MTRVKCWWPRRELHDRKSKLQFTAKTNLSFVIPGRAKREPGIHIPWRS